MLAVLCYVCGYGIVCLSILCVRVYLYLLSAGLTYLWLYACSTRITLHENILRIGELVRGDEYRSEKYVQLVCNG